MSESPTRRNVAASSPVASEEEAGTCDREEASHHRGKIKPRTRAPPPSSQLLRRVLLAVCIAFALVVAVFKVQRDIEIGPFQGERDR